MFDRVGDLLLGLGSLVFLMISFARFSRDVSRTT